MSEDREGDPAQDDAESWWKDTETAGRRGHPFQIETTIWLPQPLEEVFGFFSDAGNLEQITPSMLGFKILTPRPIDMKVGALIDYKLRVRFVPLRWRTRIAAWDPPHRFIDEQLRGPYRQWIHEHRFESRDGGTLCRDRVRYIVPGGKLVHRLVVRRDVEHIFAYRSECLARIFRTDDTADSPSP